MLWIAVIAGIFLSEYYTKDHMDKVRSLQEQRPLFNGKVILKKYYNTGAAGNFLSGSPRVMLRIHIAALCAAAAGLAVVMPLKKCMPVKTGLSFLTGGGLSNLYDRMTKGHVVDYISFGFGPKRFRRLVFNTADFFIFTGIILCGAGMLGKDQNKGH